MHNEKNEGKGASVDSEVCRGSLFAWEIDVFRRIRRVMIH